MTKTFMTPDIVAFNLAVTSKKQLIQSLCERVAHHGSLCERAVMDTIMKREKLGSTGIGDGMPPFPRFRQRSLCWQLWKRRSRMIRRMASTSIWLCLCWGVRTTAAAIWHRSRQPRSF